MRIVQIIPFVLLFGLFSCSKKILIDVTRPAKYNVSDMKRIAVLDFNGDESVGKAVAAQFADKLWKTEYFSITERTELQKVLEEQALNMSGVINDSTAVEFGKILGVEALILGNINAFSCEDIRGTEKVKERVWTGEYERDKNGKIKYEKTLFGKQKKKVYKEEFVDRQYIQREATVSISFRMVSVETGEIRASDSDSKSFSHKYVNDFKRIPPKNAILSKLTDDVLGGFIPLIAPHQVKIARSFESGNEQVGLGIEFAENGLWDKAEQIWLKETGKNKDNSAAWYNLGLAYEVQGKLDLAEQAYDQALSIEPKELYMQALSTIRKRIQEQEKLEIQFNER